MRITILGSGNVATHLGAALKNAGHRIIQVYSRDAQNAALLAYHVKAGPISDLTKINPETDLFIISVKDDAIAGIAKSLAGFGIPVTHTAGATSLAALADIAPNAGVFYPLQTFSKIREVDFWSVPLCIEGVNEQLTQMLEGLARTISNKVYRVSSHQRKTLHLAAVFACNFPNYLYDAARRLLDKDGLDFDMLRPLILETAQKVQENLPEEVQTGPAVREDESTMGAHLQLLQDEPQLAEIYTLLSQGIITNKKAGR